MKISQTADGVTELLAAARRESDARQKKTDNLGEDVAIVQTLSAEEVKAKRKIAEIQLDDDDEEEETTKVGGDETMGQEGTKGRDWYKNTKKW